MAPRLGWSTLRSSPGPKTGCSDAPGRLGGHRLAVAILTRSEDRVQRSDRMAPRLGWSTLRSSPGPKTGCSSWSVPTRASRTTCCDPHPVRRPGAAVTYCGNHAGRHGLRSSPGPKTGCSMAGRTEPGPAMWALRSSPGPKTGCSTAWTTPSPGPGGLRSSPGPKTGCSTPRRSGYRPHHAVAILTRSEDRVQLWRRETPCAYPSALRSSPGPKTGCSWLIDAGGL